MFKLVLLQTPILLVLLQSHFMLLCVGVGMRHEEKGEVVSCGMTDVLRLIISTHFIIHNLEIVALCAFYPVSSN